jgi:hypothetical protein
MNTNSKNTMISYQKGLIIAKNNKLESEYYACIADNLTPKEALIELNIYETKNSKTPNISCIYNIR